MAYEWHNRPRDPQGRFARADGEALNQQIHLRLSYDLAEAAREAAADAAEELGEYVRNALMDRMKAEKKLPTWLES